MASTAQNKIVSDLEILVTRFAPAPPPDTHLSASAVMALVRGFRSPAGFVRDLTFGVTPSTTPSISVVSRTAKLGLELLMDCELVGVRAVGTTN